MVNVPSKSNKQKTLEKRLFFVGCLTATGKKVGYGSGFVNQSYGSADPDPF